MSSDNFAEEPTPVKPRPRRCGVKKQRQNRIAPSRPAPTPVWQLQRKSFRSQQGIFKGLIKLLVSLFASDEQRQC